MVDAWLPDAEDLARYDGRLVLEWTREDPGTGRTVTKSGSAIYEAAIGLRAADHDLRGGRQGEPPVRWVRVDRLRLVTPDELAAFAEAAGLAVETLAGDYDLGPLDGGAERVVMVATRR